jgi:hypothetical protein
MPARRVVNLAMRVQPRQRIVSDRTQRDDLFSRLKRQRIVDFDDRNFCIAQQIAGSAVMYFCRSVRLVTLCPCHVGLPPLSVDVEFVAQMRDARRRGSSFMVTTMVAGGLRVSCRLHKPE